MERPACSSDGTLSSFHVRLSSTEQDKMEAQRGRQTKSVLIAVEGASDHYVGTYMVQILSVLCVSPCQSGISPESGRAL